MRIVDTHLHLVYLDRFSYPWLDDVPSLKHNFPVAEYVRQAKPLGIEAALYMEVDVADGQREDEARFATSIDPFVTGAIVSGRPESADFPQYLETVAGIGGVRGIRRILHTSPDELSQSALFAQNLRKLEDYDLPFDLCVLARQLPVGRALVDKCPDVQFVLDHCGVPDIAGGDFATWRDEISELAQRPNVAAKISGVVAYAGNEWTAADLRPYVEHVIASFGWNRVVWGSDFPVCTLTADLARWVEATNQIVAGASESEKSRLFHQNAERIYHLA